MIVPSIPRPAPPGPGRRYGPMVHGATASRWASTDACRHHRHYAARAVRHPSTCMGLADPRSLIRTRRFVAGLPPSIGGIDSGSATAHEPHRSRGRRHRRVHDGSGSSLGYLRSPARGFEKAAAGADLITDPALRSGFHPDPRPVGAGRHHPSVRRTAVRHRGGSAAPHHAGDLSGGVSDRRRTARADRAPDDVPGDRLGAAAPDGGLLFEPAPRPATLMRGVQGCSPCC